MATAMTLPRQLLCATCSSSRSEWQLCPPRHTTVGVIYAGGSIPESLARRKPCLEAGRSPVHSLRVLHNSQILDPQARRFQRVFSLGRRSCRWIHLRPGVKGWRGPDCSGQGLKQGKGWRAGMEPRPSQNLGQHTIREESVVGEAFDGELEDERRKPKSRAHLELARGCEGGGQTEVERWGVIGKVQGMVLLTLPALALEGPQSVVQALGVLAAIITVHEAGHFLAARLQGIHVTKFAIGFGPTLAKIQGKKVEYSLRAFPLGGFVAFPDDDPESAYKADDPDLLKNRPIPQRALVISAGVLANILFAYTVLFTQVLTVGLLEQEFFPGVVVPEVIVNSAAARAGVFAGDVVAAVDGRKLGSREASVFDLVDTIKRSPNHKLVLSVKRGADEVSLQVVPDVAIDGSGKIGVQLSPNAKPHRVRAENLADAAVLASRDFSRLFTTVIDGLRQVFFNFAQTADKLSGPVAIVAVGAEVARADVAGLFQFAAIVNINLAVVNLLPLPALDGGYLALVALEAVRGGKKLPDGVEQGIMSSGILLLLALGVVLMVRDTINLGIVQQML